MYMLVFSFVYINVNMISLVFVIVSGKKSETKANLCRFIALPSKKKDKSKKWKTLCDVRHLVKQPSSKSGPLI